MRISIIIAIASAALVAVSSASAQGFGGHSGRGRHGGGVRDRGGIVGYQGGGRGFGQYAGGAHGGTYSRGGRGYGGYGYSLGGGLAGVALGATFADGYPSYYSDNEYAGDTYVRNMYYGGDSSGYVNPSFADQGYVEDAWGGYAPAPSQSAYGQQGYIIQSQQYGAQVYETGGVPAHGYGEPQGYGAAPVYNCGC